MNTRIIKTRITAAIFLFIIEGIGFGQNSTLQIKNISKLKPDRSADTIQYCLGVFVMNQLLQNGFTVENPLMFKKAIEDVLQQKTLLVDINSVERRLANYQRKQTEDRNKRIETLLFAQLKTMPDLGMLPGGVYYKVDKMGTGRKAGTKDSVLLNLVGATAAGSVFVNTSSQHQPLMLVPEELLTGLKDILQIMPEGSVWKVFVPATQARGKLAGFPIPQGIALVFDIGVLSVYPIK